MKRKINRYPDELKLKDLKAAQFAAFFFKFLSKDGVFGDILLYISKQ